MTRESMQRTPVRLDRVTVGRGDVAVVKDASFAIAPGEIVALLGPSGAGKSSLLLALSGLIPFSGTIDRPDQIGVVFQDHGVFHWLTVEGNVRFGISHLPAKERDRQVTEVLELARIPELRKRYPAQLSGGQRQRVAIARTLATQPQLLLLDEPFASLDMLTRTKLADWVRSLTARLAIPVLMVSHDLDDAIRIADRIAVLVNGRLTFVPFSQTTDHGEVREMILRSMSDDDMASEEELYDA